MNSPALQSIECSLRDRRKASLMRTLGNLHWNLGRFNVQMLEPKLARCVHMQMSGWLTLMIHTYLPLEVHVSTYLCMS